MRIYVGNLSFDTSSDALNAEFARFGAVEEVFMPTDRESGRPRGFAYVSMANDDEAKAAMEALNGTDLDGRSLKVNEAQAREDRGGGGGGGGRGGGGGGRGGRGGGGGGGGGRW